MPKKPKSRLMALVTVSAIKVAAWYKIELLIVNTYCMGDQETVNLFPKRNYFLFGALSRLLRITPALFGRGAVESFKSESPL